MAKDKKYSFSAEEESGQNTTLLIGALLVMVIIVGGALLYILGQRTLPPVPPANQTDHPANGTIVPPANNTNGTTTPPCDDQCLYQKGIGGKNLSWCLLMQNDTLRQSCFQFLSSESLDACKLLTDESKKEPCITAFAKSRNDSSICNDLKDSTNCKKAADPCFLRADQKICQALRDKDPAKCQFDTACLINYSLTESDPSSCSMIQNEVAVKACLSALGQTDKCSDFPSVSQRDYCYQLFATYSGDYLVCTQISASNMYMVDCLSTLGARAKNSSLCLADGLGVDTLWACYINYSLISGDPSACYLIDPLASTNRFKCATEFAKKYGDPSACLAITESLTQRSTCYESVIIYNPANLDWTKCDPINDFNWRNKCYTESAKVNRNIGLCDHIDVDYARTSCQDSYNTYIANQPK